MNAILLAGGESSRYGSNKAFIKWENGYLIQHLSQKLNLFFDQVYVIVDRQENFEFLQEVKVIEDIIKGVGPLGGLYTGLRVSSDSRNYLTACDMPFLESEYIKLLKEESCNYDVLVSRYKGYLEPFGGIYSRRCLPVIKDIMGKDKFKISTIFPRVATKVIEEEMINQIASPDRIFYNINYRTDLKQIHAGQF